MTNRRGTGLRAEEVAVAAIAFCALVGRSAAADWRSGYDVFIYGSPPLDFISGVHGSVNAWGAYGFGVTEGEKAYVDLVRAAGVKVMGNLITMQGSAAQDDELALRAACRTLKGKPTRAFWIQPNPPYLMCHNNFEWQLYLKRRAREQIDGNVDGIHIDEIEGIGGHLYLAGFCDSCMAAFRTYLSLRYTAEELDTRFGIDDISTFSYGQTLVSLWAKGPWDDPNAERAREFVRFQMASRRQQIEELILDTRAYAGRDLAFSGNTFYLSANKHPFVKDLDFMTFENRFLMPPRGKYTATYLLGRALGGDRDPVMFPDILVLATMGTRDYAVVRHWILEACASGGFFLLPKDAYTFGGGRFPLPLEEVAAATDFLYVHRDLYSGSSAVGRVAVIYDFNAAFAQYVADWYRMPWFAGEPFHVTFMGAAAALQEAHVPFDVVYVGDGDFVDEPLILAKIERFDVLILPHVGSLDAASESVLRRYEDRGRKVLKTYDMTKSYWFFRGKAVRDRLARMVEDAAGGAAVDTNAQASLSILPRVSSTFDIHFVNYDYDAGAHAFREAANVQVSLAIPDGVRLDGKRLILAAPGEADTRIPFEAKGGRASFTVPRITDYAVASFR